MIRETPMDRRPEVRLPYTRPCVAERGGDRQLAVRSAVRHRVPAPGAVPAEHERGRDEREVRQRLREGSELSFRHGVVLLREQPDVVAQVEETLEDLARLIMMPLLVKHRGEPERAREE